MPVIVKKTVSGLQAKIGEVLSDKQIADLKLTDERMRWHLKNGTFAAFEKRGEEQKQQKD